MKKTNKILIILIFSLICYGCGDSLLESNESYTYDMEIITNMNCQHLHDNWYEIILDPDYVQTFIQVELETSDERVNYVNWEWEASDTSHYYFNGNDYGVIPPTNASSVVMDNTARAVFGFHSTMVSDTIAIYGVFIDSKILLNAYEVREVYFIVRL